MYGSERWARWKCILVLLGRASVVKLLYVGLKARRKQASKPTNTERNEKKRRKKRK
jgi:hypothetical protein